MNINLLAKDPAAFVAAIRDPAQKPALSALLARDPQAFLKPLQNVPGAAAAVAALVDDKTAAVVASVCTETILSAGPDQLHVSLFLHLASHDVPDVPRTLLPLLASDYAPQATLGLVAWTRRTGGSELVACVQDMLSSGADFAVLAPALETFLPLVPALVPLYTSPECKAVFMERAPHMQDAPALLRVVSASCVYESARVFNKDSYLPVLIQGARQPKVDAADAASRDAVQALSLLCIVKLWNFSAVEASIPLAEITSSLRDLFLAPRYGPSSDRVRDVQEVLRTDNNQYILEAFSYLSLGQKTRQAWRADPDLTNQLLLVLETSKSAAVLYAGLQTLANLTRFEAPSAASGIKNAVSKDDETAQQIQSFNRNLVCEYKLVQTLCALPLKANDLNLSSHRVQILHNLTSSQPSSVQRDAVSQGALPVLLDYLVGVHVARNERQKGADYFGDSEPLLACTRALANVCRSVDPRLAFSKYSVETCVPFLVELLKSENPAVSILDRLHALLALTNVSSLSNEGLHALIASRTADVLPDLYLDPVPEIQKAAWELVNNIISHPLMLAKFFNADNAQSRKNLDILVKLLHSKDPALQTTIAGILANSTMEYDIVCRTLLDLEHKQLLPIICDILHHQWQNEDLLLRVLSLLLSLKMADGKHAFFGGPLKAELRRVSSLSRNKEVLEMISEVLST